MTPDFTGDLAIFLAELGVLFTAFGICGFVADFILPYIKPIERYRDSLPDYEDDVEIARRYEEAHRKWAARTRAKAKSFVRHFFCFAFTNR